jgi:UDP-N-acetylglucosamine 2-epimerase (non-hydrolysing)
MMRPYLIVLGTRPEIIKCAPLIAELQNRQIAYHVVHTGQHYSPELDGHLFKELALPDPLVNLAVGSLSPLEQMGAIINGVSAAIHELKPKFLCVQGDTNSVLGGALAGFKAGVPVVHIEAGLRSNDWSMPEEGNRVLTDRMSQYLFAPTETQRTHLLQEGIQDARIFVVGNTIVDAVKRFCKKDHASALLQSLGLFQQPYILLTLHRPSNVDDPEVLKAQIFAVEQAARAKQLKVIFPVHPRTRAVLERAGIELSEIFFPIDPIGYRLNLSLIANAVAVMTDSGGMQEEACILHVPCVTLRQNTERPETIVVGANVLCGIRDTAAVRAAVDWALESRRQWTCPFGKGETSEVIIDVLEAAQV